MLYTAKYMHQILNLSIDSYEEIFREIDTTNLVEKKGIIYVWTNQNLKSRDLEIKIRNDLGIEQKLLTQKEILELEPNLEPVLSTGRSIAPHLQKGQLVVLESSTYPGTTDELLKPSQLIWRGHTRVLKIFALFDDHRPVRSIKMSIS